MDLALTSFSNGIQRSRRVGLAHLIVLILVSGFQSCASVGSQSDRAAPISNPFSNYSSLPRANGSQNVILRTKKGDHAVELQLPADDRQLSDLSIPVASELRGHDQMSQNSLNFPDEDYKSRTLGIADREMIQRFPAGLTGEQNIVRDQIEKDLYLYPSEETIFQDQTPSYLASMDRIRMLFRTARYEAALLESDQVLKEYPTDPKIHEMRGTLFDRIGQRELALQSWNQSLRLNPKNTALRRFVDRKRYNSELVGAKK